MIIYNSNATDFTHNGLGFLTDVINANVIDALNGEYTLNFEYPTSSKMCKYLIEGNIVKCKVADGSQQLFTITNVVKTYKTYKVSCSHIFYRLLSNFCEDVYPQNLDGADYLNWILTHTQYTSGFTGYSNIATIKSGRYVRMNPVECILGAENSMVNTFGGEIKRDNFKIYFNTRIGNDEGVKLLFGKNITGINVNIDLTNCYTRIMPMGYDGLLLPEKYIDSTLINNYPYPRIALMKFEDVKFDPNSEEAYHTLDEAYQALRDRVQEQYDAGCDKPAVNISVDWLELSKTEEYKNYASLERVHLGDTITANILGMDFTTRCIKTTYNPLTDTIEKFEIGTFKSGIGDSINIMNKVITQYNPSTILEEARDSATALITQAMGGYVYKTNSELYIMDTDNPNTAEKVWRWNINGLGYSSTGINGPYGIAMTMDGSIVADYITTGTLNTNVIQGYDSLVVSVHDATDQVAALTITVNELNSKIQDVLDITTSGESDVCLVELYNINGSEPILVQVHPINVDLKNLYPQNTLYPGNSLYPHNSVLRFSNLETGDVVQYEMPGDLLWLNSDVYDTFTLDYDNHVCQIEHKVGIDGQGQKYELSTPVIESFTYPYIELTTGDTYQIELVGETSGYLFVRLMAANIYTTQFATRSEVQQTADAIITSVEREYATKDLMYSEIEQTADSINLEVGKKVGKDSVISSINLTPETAKITASHVDLQGYTTFTDLATGGRSTINGANITTGTLDASRVNVTNLSANSIRGGTINGNNVSVTNLSADNIKSGTLKSAAININGKFKVNSSGRMIAYGSSSSKWISMDAGSNHFAASGLNVDKDNGISFRYMPGPDDIRAEYGSISREHNRLRLSSQAGGDDVQVYGPSVYLSASTSGGFVLLVPGSNSHAFVGGTDRNNRILTNGGDPSSRNVKENFEDIDDEYKDIYEDLKNLHLYNYDYKYKNISDTKNDYGFIIDDIEDSKHLSKYFRNYKSVRYINKDNELITKTEDNLDEIKKCEPINIKEWDKASYIKGLFVLVKSLQNEIEDLKEEIKNLKGSK